MADTRAIPGLTPQQWDDKYFNESIQGDVFTDLMGEGVNSPIQVKTDLTAKPGDSVTFALVNRLTGDGVIDDETLEGNEEDLGKRSQKVTTHERAHAVRVSTYQEQLSAIPLREAAKDSLKTWVSEDTRDRIIDAMGSVASGPTGPIRFQDATETQRDAWLANNPQTLYGAAVANTVASDSSASLLNVDATNDKLTRRAVSLLKRRALARIGDRPKIRPLRIGDKGKRFFVAYASPLQMRDLRADMESVLDDTTAAGEAIALFEGGDLYWDGVIIKELDEMPNYAGLGASGIDVAPFYLIGAQALGLAKVRPWRTREKDFDYGRKKGVAIVGFDGIEKLRFGTGATDLDAPKDNGIATGFFANVGD